MTTGFTVRALACAATLSLFTLAELPTAFAEGDPPAEAPERTSVEEQLARQAELLEQMRLLLERQQEEIERLRSEVDALKPSAKGASAEAPAAPAASTAQADEPHRRIEELERRWGNLELSGDLRFRYEGFYNQGYDAPQNVEARNRFRLRARAVLRGRIDEHFDWGIGLASGTLDAPNSSNQTITDFYNRKPFALDLAYLHFTTASEPVQLEVYAGKFEFPWKRTSVTFDDNLRPEGLSERLSFDLGDASPLREVTLTAWQLPFKELAVGPDGALFGGQVLTGWQLAPRWEATLSASFLDFEQVDLIPPAVGVPSTLVNAGFDYATTNALVLDPATGRLQFRSDYRTIDAIAEVGYAGWGPSDAAGTPRWPVTLRADWLHNTSAYNNQRDGGTLAAEVGRARETGDWRVGYTFWKVEREAFPSVFMESNVSLQTNSIAHILEGTYVWTKGVLLQPRWTFTRRLQTLSPINRWQSRFQFEVTYRF